MSGRIVRVTEAVRITEYTDDTASNDRQPRAALPRGYNPETDSPLAGRTNAPLKWTGPLTAGEVEAIRQRVEDNRPRRWRWSR